MCSNLLLTSFLASLFLLGSCKKDGADDNSPVENDSLLQTGPMFAKLGKRINLKDHGNASNTGNYWGRDFNELFVSINASLLRINLLELKVEEIEKSGGLFTGKSENSGIVFIGTLNGVMGYYHYKFATNEIEKIMSLSRDHATSLQMAENTIIFRNGIVGPPTNPCEGNDFICSDNPTIKSQMLNHVDKTTRQITPLPRKQFRQFSKDGTKTILVDSFDYSLTYVFDNDTRSYIDSFVTPYNISDNNEWSDTFFENKYVSYITDGTGQVIKQDVKTGLEESRFTLPIINSQLIKLSPDGTKLIYKGLSGSDSEKILLGIYDMVTEKDRIIASFSQEESMRIDAKNVKLSEDNKRLLVLYDSDLYIMDVE
jgi:hypothetical protein